MLGVEGDHFQTEGFKIAEICEASGSKLINKCLLKFEVRVGYSLDLQSKASITSGNGSQFCIISFA